MPEKRKWTEEEDALIRVGRRNRVPWEILARQVRVSRYTLIEHAREIGAWDTAVTKPRSEEPVTRDALPAGHPETWGAITRGTLLHGAKYTYQPPLTLGLAEWKERAEWKSSIAQYRWVAA